VSYLDTLDPKYRLILCDIWGVVHDGVTLYPGASKRLLKWRQEGRCVILITNAPRTAHAVEQQLAHIGVPREAYDFVATSGEAGIEALVAWASWVGQATARFLRVAACASRTTTISGISPALA
jgi:ribonucleotide monophosphatase NagD (HAD superfamily)